MSGHRINADLGLEPGVLVPDDNLKFHATLGVNHIQLKNVGACTIADPVRAGLLLVVYVVAVDTASSLTVDGNQMDAVADRGIFVSVPTSTAFEWQTITATVA
jgi:hypothetical protein